MKILSNLIINGGWLRPNGDAAQVGDSVRLYLDDGTEIVGTIEFPIAEVNCGQDRAYRVAYDREEVIRAGDVIDGVVLDGLGNLEARIETLESISQNLIYLSSYVESDTDLSLDGNTVGEDVSSLVQTVLNKAIDSSLNLIWDVSITAKGLRIYSNTTITVTPNCGAKLSNNANMPLLQNANSKALASLEIEDIVSDENISIIGGIWHGNGDNQEHDTEDEGWIVAMRFFNIRNLLLNNIIVFKPRTFTVHFANWKQVSYIKNNIDVGTASGFNYDGLHFNGPGQDLYGQNLVVKTMDDGLAISPNDIISQSNGDPSVYGPFSGPGDITDVLIDGVTLTEGTSFGIRLLTSANLLDRVTIRNVKGITNSQAFIIDNYSEDPSRMGPPGPGNVGKVTIDGVDVQIVGGGYKQSIAFIAAKAKDIHFNNIVRDGSTQVSFPTVRISTGSDIDNLSLNNYRFQSETATAATLNHILAEGGSIANLLVSNVIAQNNNVPLNGQGCLLKVTGASINRTTISSVTGNGLGSLVYEESGTAGSLILIGDNYLYSEYSILPQPSGSGINFINFWSGQQGNFDITYTNENSDTFIIKNSIRTPDDVRVSGRFNTTTWDNTKQFGVMARATPTNLVETGSSSYALAITESSVTLIRGNGAVSPIVLATTSIDVSLSANSWYKLYLECEGINLRGYIFRELDGQWLQSDGSFGLVREACISTTDATNTSGGHGAFTYSEGNSGYGRIREIKFEEL